MREAHIRNGALSQFRIQKLRFFAAAMLEPHTHLHEHFYDFNRLRRTQKKVVKKSKTFSFIFRRRKQRQFQDQLTSHHARQTQNILLLSEHWNLEVSRVCSYIHANLKLLLVLIKFVALYIFLDHHQTYSLSSFIGDNFKEILLTLCVSLEIILIIINSLPTVVFYIIFLSEDEERKV